MKTQDEAVSNLLRTASKLYVSTPNESGWRNIESERGERIAEIRCDRNFAIVLALVLNEFLEAQNQITLKKEGT